MPIHNVTVLLNVRINSTCYSSKFTSMQIRNLLEASLCLTILFKLCRLFFLTSDQEVYEIDGFGFIIC